MKLRKIYREQKIFSEVEKVWQFFSSPKNLSTITPHWLDFRVITDIPERMYAGMIIEYRIRPVLGIPIKWITEITHVRDFEFFVDEQRFGPYKFWHHKHLFLPKESYVLMVDDVDYIMPYGFLGDILHFYVSVKLKEIFDFRYKRVEEIFNLS
ncbi:MAG: SRPBCC family protein [Calditerrivibrio sp.]|nr:SRPBCC family protein [Calditerrivibrio sp.]